MLSSDLTWRRWEGQTVTSLLHNVYYVKFSPRRLAGRRDPRNLGLPGFDGAVGAPDTPAPVPQHLAAAYGLPPGITWKRVRSGSQ